MKRFLPAIYLLVLFSTVFLSCRKEEEFTNDAGINLQFSDDTLWFDTVFTQFNSGNRPLSVTRQLRVSNTNEKAVRVNIRLRGNNYGVFKLNIDGQPANGGLAGKEIMGKDSIVIFVQVYLDSSNGNASQQFLVTDQLLFETNGNVQDVDLVTKGKDAVFQMDSVLNCATGNLVWTKDKPYVIYNSILVPEGCTLTIQPGTHIYSHVKSMIYIAGTLVVNGTADDPVIFEGDRLEPDYKEIPGQWGGIRLLTTSRDNVIKHAIVKNGIVGVEVDSASLNSNPKLVIRESIIQYMSGAGLVGYTADLLAENNLVTNCGQFTFLGAYGGNYRLYHNTFVTINSLTGFARNNPTFLLDNSPLPDKTAFPLTCYAVNNIIWGNNDDEFLINSAQGGNPSVSIIMQNSLVKAKDDNIRILLETPGTNNIINQDPQFEDAGGNHYAVKAGSPAKGKAAALNFRSDLAGKPRGNPPTMGCYE